MNIQVLNSVESKSIREDLNLNPSRFFAEEFLSSQVIFDSPTNTYIIFRYDDVVSCLKNPNLSSVFHDPGFSSSALFFIDAPQHTRMRDICMPSCSKNKFSQLQSLVSSKAHQMMSELNNGEYDFVDMVARRLPVQILAKFIGLESQDYEAFANWIDEILRTNFSLSGQEVSALELAASELFMEELIKKQSNPADDLLTAVSQALQQNVVSKKEAIELILSFFIAGVATSQLLIGNCLALLLEHPQQLKKLRQMPELIDSTIEEVLRFAPPGIFTSRHTKSAINLGDSTIPEGSRVALFISIANRDPSLFSKPEQFDISRQKNRHLSFGRGLHSCMGAFLGKMEAREVLLALLKNNFDMNLVEKIDATHLPSYPSAMGFKGYKKLRVEFS